MAKREVKAGVVDQTIDIFVNDSTSTTGAGLTGLVFNTASLVCYYRKGATGAVTQLTLATQTVTGAHSDGGFVELSSANMPGMYRLDLSDTMVAATGMLTIMLKGATAMAPVAIELEIVAVDKFDTVRMGLTALPNASAEAAGGLYTRGTGAGQINQDANGRVDTRSVDMATDVITAASIQANAITDAKVASDVTIASVTGAVGSVTGNVGGNVTGSVGSVVAGVTLADGVDHGGSTAKLRLGSSSATAAFLVTNSAGVAVSFQSSTTHGLLAAGGVSGGGHGICATGGTDSDGFNGLGNGTGVGFRSVPDAVGFGGPTVADIADAVWDEDATGHQTQGSFGQAIGDPVADTDTIWGLVNTNLDAAISSRMATYTQPTGFLAATFPGGTIANTTNITAGTITTVTNLTNAPTAGDLTATMKASVNTEIDTALADVRLDELLAADSDIDGAAPPTVGSVFHELMTKTAGSFTYDQTTDSLEAIRDRGDAAWIVTAADIDQIVDEVWDELIVSHLGPGSTGAALNAAGSAGDPWTTPLPGAYGAGTAGNIIGNNLDAPVSGVTVAVLDEPIADHQLHGSVGESISRGQCKRN
jgi:hypothetical protein